MIRNLLLTFALLLSGTAIFAQTALQGKVTDEKGEPLIEATVRLFKKGIFSAGINTDIDGNYNVKVDPGTYDVEVSYVGYKTNKITGVKVLVGINNFLDIKMEEQSNVIGEVVIKEYKAPLFQKDNTTGGRTITSEEIAKMPTRNINAIAASAAGVSSIDGGDLNIKGSRSNATNYYLDGIRVFGALPPQTEIDQLQVITGGLEAQYGDVTGGVIAVTSKGPSSRFTGGLEVETSKYLDNFGNNLVNANLSGPIIKKKTGETVLGFRIAGQFSTAEDDGPSAFGVFRAKDDVIARVEKQPVRKVGETLLPEGEFIRNEDVKNYRTRPFEGNRRYDLTGKVDARISKDIDLAITGTYFYQENQFTPGGWSMLNSQNNPTQYNARYRANARLRHRLGGNTAADAQSRKGSLIRNAAYTLQFGYENATNESYDPRHKDRLFDYGYVGKFNFDWIPVFGESSWSQAPEVDVPGRTLKAGHVGFSRVFSGAEMSQTINPVRGNYNNFANPEDFNTYLAINGRLSDLFTSPWGLFTNVGAVNNSYTKGKTEIYTFSATSGFDLVPGGSERGRHSIQFGVLYEQRIQRSYGVSPIRLWELAQQSANRHIIGVDTNTVVGSDTARFLLLDGTRLVPLVTPTELKIFRNLTTDDVGKADPDLFFYKELRQAIGKNIHDFVNVDALRPDQLKLSMFAPKELTDLGLVDFFGYNYLGDQIGTNVKFNDFFTRNRQTGRRDFLVAPFQPIYMAAYIQDKFVYKDIIFRVGLRVDRYDANTKVMRDPFSLYQIVSASDFHNRTKTSKPGSIGEDYKVYVDRPGSDVVRAYRNGEQWYYPNGTPANDGLVLFGGEVVSPKLVQFNGKDPDITQDGFDPNSAFEDYKPQLNWMPRLAFSFPISDDANFFAHYDITVQRPPSNSFANALDYFYFFVPGRFNEASNPALRPEKTIDYEVGFQQKLTNSSALKINAYYREMRDMVQLRTYLYVPVVNQYTTFDNRDFGTVKGFTFQYDLRRTNNISTTIAYTLQFADGTGSDATSQRGLTTRGNLRTLFPLSFDERHNIAITLDYRYDEGKRYNGPRINGVNILEKTGVNFQIFAVSGRPYTKKLEPTAFGGIGTVGQINGSNLPWRLTVDMRLDRSFPLTKADAKRPLDLNVFLRIQNLFDARNVIGVYPFTGSEKDDGFLLSRQGQDRVDAVRLSGRDYQAYVQSYQRALINNGFFTLPRRIFLGATFNF